MPPARKYVPPTSPLEEKVRRLESDLYFARITIIGLTQPEFRKLLSEAASCKAFNEVYAWAQNTAERIIELAGQTETPAGRDWDGRMRVLCPLCGDKPQSPYDDGFLLDEGLRRHLLGTYNSHQCSVFKAAHELALDQARRNEVR